MSQNKIIKIVVVMAIVLLGASGASALIWHWRSQPTIDMRKALETNDIVPLIIVGSGPAALSAGLYGARAKIKTVVIAGNERGGALTKTSYIENWPGRTKILGTDLMNDLQEQVQQFGVEIINDSVVKVDFNVWPFELTTENGKTLRALTVIIATGSTPRTLGIPGEKEYWGKGVTTCAVCDAPFHKDKEVIVIGGGDSAIEEAVQLASYAKKVTILVRGASMRAAASMQDRLHEYPSIEVKFNSQVRSVIGDGSQVTGAEVFDSKSDTLSTMPVSGVFLAIGHDPNSKLFKKFLKIDTEGTIAMSDRTQATSLKGIFAAGDVTDHRYRQAGVAAGDGIKAALDAVAFLQEHGFSTNIAAQLEKRYVSGVPEERAEIPLMKTVAEIKDIIDAAQGLVVIDFYAPHCPSCMRMLPAVEAVAHQFADQVAFLKVDTSISPEIAQEYHVPTIPCMLVFNEKQLVARYNQSMSRKQLEEFILKLLKDS